LAEFAGLLLGLAEFVGMSVLACFVLTIRVLRGFAVPLSSLRELDAIEAGMPDSKPPPARLTMTPPESESLDPPPAPSFFVTTRWTVVLAAGQRERPQAAEALEELCGTYWYPLYAYVRRQGYSREDSKDLVQGFFSQFLDRNDLAGLSSEKGVSEQLKAFITLEKGAIP
jgi:hypothetical protein